MTPQGGDTPPAATWLREALAGGAVESNRLKAAATIAGISPKALRIARERLGIVTTRSGRRATMRSTWALPAPPIGQDAPAIGQALETPSATRAAAALSTGVKVPTEVANLDEADLLPGERRRVAQRVDRFLERGMERAAAQSLAVRLVVERDRTNSREGSCLECSVFEDGRCLPGTRGDTPGPRPPAEIWMCWTARRD